jgi:two-component system, OmpR family, response regulator
MERPFTIVVAENDPGMRDVIEEALRSEDRRVVGAQDGLDTLMAAVQEGPDLVVLDLALSEESGCDVIQLLRCCGTTADVPIIALSGPADSTLVERAFGTGADDVLPKPVVPAQLRARVETWLLRGHQQIQRAA